MTDLEYSTHASHTVLLQGNSLIRTQNSVFINIKSSTVRKVLKYNRQMKHSPTNHPSFCGWSSTTICCCIGGCILMVFRHSKLCLAQVDFAFNSSIPDLPLYMFVNVLRDQMLQFLWFGKFQFLCLNRTACKWTIAVCNQNDSKSLISTHDFEMWMPFLSALPYCYPALWFWLSIFLEASQRIAWLNCVLMFMFQTDKCARWKEMSTCVSRALP